MKQACLTLVFEAIVGGVAGCSGDGNVPRVTALNRTTHASKFPIAQGAHASATCDDCHGTFDTFTQFTCLTSACHLQAATDPVHSGVSGYSFASNACRGCHPEGNANFVHDKFPIGAGTHHVDSTCSGCHTGSTFGDFSCLGCHPQGNTDGAHAGVPGYSYESPRCYSCHPEGNANFVHDKLPIGTGTHHVDRTCTGCHTGSTFDVFSCLGCHPQGNTDGAHAGVSGYSYESPRCYSCHPAGEATVDHARFFPISQGALHAGLACADCHTDPSTHAVATCNVCHAHTAAAMPAKHTDVGGFLTDSTVCLRCHADSQVTRVAAHLPFRITNGAAHYQKSCLVCHPQMRTDKPYGTDFSPGLIDCTSCHPKWLVSTAHVFVSGYEYKSTTCIRGGCHANGAKPGN